MYVYFYMALKLECDYGLDWVLNERNKFGSFMFGVVCCPHMALHIKQWFYYQSTIYSLYKTAHKYLRSITSNLVHNLAYLSSFWFQWKEFFWIHFL